MFQEFELKSPWLKINWTQITIAQRIWTQIAMAQNQLNSNHQGSRPVELKSHLAWADFKIKID